MADQLDHLAAGIMRDAANTVDKVKDLARSANWTADEALSRLSTMFRDLADIQEKRPDHAP